MLFEISDRIEKKEVYHFAILCILCLQLHFCSLNILRNLIFYLLFIITLFKTTILHLAPVCLICVISRIGKMYILCLYKKKAISILLLPV